MDAECRGVFVAVCGRVERVDVTELSLAGLCSAVAARFDIGDRLRFISDEEGEPEVTSDDHLRRLAHRKQTLRVLIGDSALSDLEQRMWHLRQLQWGFFQDELARVKNQSQGLRNEMRQLRVAMEQSARREVELTGELMNERRLREQVDQAAVERHEALVAELRREQRARDTTEAALRKDLEDARQASLKFAANADRQNTELKGAVMEETQNRGKNIEALLVEWAGSQAEIRQAMEVIRNDLNLGAQDAERQANNLVQEASAREAFEQFISEKVRGVDIVLGKFEGVQLDFDRRVAAIAQQAENSRNDEKAERLAEQHELRSQILEWLAARENAASIAKSISTSSPSPATLPTLRLQTMAPGNQVGTFARHPSPSSIQRTTIATSPSAVQRNATPPPPSGPMSAPPTVASPKLGTQLISRGQSQTTMIHNLVAS